MSKKALGRYDDIRGRLTYFQDDSKEEDQPSEPIVASAGDTDLGSFPLNSKNLNSVETLVGLDGKQLSKEEARFKEVAPSSDKTCATCRFFLRSSGVGIPGKCEVVEGDIPWHSTSDYYISAEDEAEAAFDQVKEPEDNSKINFSDGESVITKDAAQDRVNTTVTLSTLISVGPSSFEQTLRIPTGQGVFPSKITYVYNPNTNTIEALSKPNGLFPASIKLTFRPKQRPPDNIVRSPSIDQEVKTQIESLSFVGDVVFDHEDLTVLIYKKRLSILGFQVDLIVKVRKRNGIASLSTTAKADGDVPPTEQTQPVSKEETTQPPAANLPPWNTKCAFAASQYPDGNQFVWNSTECQDWFAAMGSDGKSPIANPNS